MDKTNLVDFIVSLDKLSHDFNGLWIGNGFPLLDDGVEITLTEFSNEVCIIFCCVNIVEMKNMFLSCKGFESGHFQLKEHLIDGVLEFSHFDDLDTDRFLVSFVDAFVDSAAITFADMLVDWVGVAFDCFHLCYR